MRAVRAGVRWPLVRVEPLSHRLGAPESYPAALAALADAHFPELAMQVPGIYGDGGTEGSGDGSEGSDAGGSEGGSKGGGEGGRNGCGKLGSGNDGGQTGGGDEGGEVGEGANGGPDGAGTYTRSAWPADEASMSTCRDEDNSLVVWFWMKTTAFSASSNCTKTISADTFRLAGVTARIRTSEAAGNSASKRA